MQFNLTSLVGILLFVSAITQQTFALSTEDQSIDEVIVVGIRSHVPGQPLPHSITRITQQDIFNRSYRSLPQSLRDVPGVMVQETAFGQGSPYIRGFTGFRNLLLIDGVRLNNSTFREGPNQYWATVDVNSIDAVEVISGPLSTLYGTDAIGGTVNLLTKDPMPDQKSNISYRYSTAEHSSGISANLSTRHWLLDFGKKRFGDLDGGDDIGRQKNIGYGERNFSLKFKQLFANDIEVTALHQNLSQDEVPRTHKTVFSKSWEGTSTGSDLRRDLNQDRALTYLKLEKNSQVGLFDTFSLTTSHQVNKERRYRIKSNNSEQVQGFRTSTYGISFTGHRTTSLVRITAGVDYYRDEVTSFSSSNPIQGPVADDATYDNFDVFTQADFDLNDKLFVSLGLRHTTIGLDADQVLDISTNSPMKIDDDWNTAIGSARLFYKATPALSLFAGVSQSYRAPNLSDTTRFDSARTNEFETPTRNLKPEHFTTTEVGFEYQNGQLQWELSAYYTNIDDMIIRTPTGRIFDGDYEVIKNNSGEGYVTGTEITGSYVISENSNVYVMASYLRGRVKTYPFSSPEQVEEPIDRMMPLMISLGYLWSGSSYRKPEFEITSRYAAKQDDLSTRDSNDTSRIPPGGTPEYLVLDLRYGFMLTDNLKINLVADNLLNKDYRVHGSGTNMPGRNFIVNMSLNF